MRVCDVIYSLQLFYDQLFGHLYKIGIGEYLQFYCLQSKEFVDIEDKNLVLHL